MEENIHVTAQLPGYQRDLDVPQYYVWSPRTAPKPEARAYFILDSTRDDAVTAGPTTLRVACWLAASLNADALKLEAAAAADDDQPKSGRLYQLTGDADARCISNGYRWSESEVND
jgi:hypothetical protein